MPKILTLATLALVAIAMTACNKAQDDAARDQRHFDSLIARRDSMLGRIKSRTDSLGAVLANEKATGIVAATPMPVGSDSDLREHPIVLPEPSASGVSRSALPSSPTPTPRQPMRPRPPLNAMTERALARGDSIARADADRTFGTHGRGNGGGDTLRGVVEIRGTAPRLVLKLPNRTSVALNGMATAGIEELNGVEIMARGLKVSSQDMVVEAYVVRSVKGAPAIDGHLDLNGNGWIVALTGNTGTQKLSNVPQALQQSAGSRVWVTLVPHSNVPQAYGVITKR